MNNMNMHYKFFKDADGDLGDQLEKFFAQEGFNVITYIDHYDKQHDNSGVLVCYVILGGQTDESNGSTEK